MKIYNKSIKINNKFDNNDKFILVIFINKSIFKF